jgi:xanthine dehydrogenase accessory factor
MTKDWVQQLQTFKDEQRACVLVTVTEVKGSAPGSVGAKLVVTHEESFGTVGGGAVELDAISKARTLLQTGGMLETRITLSDQKQCCGGSMKLLLECLFQGPRLHIFGAGHVGAQVADLVQGTRFSVSLIDEREDWRAPAPLPEGARLHLQNSIEYLKGLDADAKRDFALIMAPTHEQDYAVLSQCLSMPFAWIGLIGSKNKVAAFKKHLKQDGYSEEACAAFVSPIGLRAVGRSPREVAIAITHDFMRFEGEMHTC